MLTISVLTSKVEHYHQSHRNKFSLLSLPSSWSAPTPPSLRRQTTLHSHSTLLQLLSCPNLPISTSSLPTVTSAVAYGATTPTVDILGVNCTSKNKEAGAYTKYRRLSMTGFPWDNSQVSGMASPAAENTGTIAGRCQIGTPPVQMVEPKSEPTVPWTIDHSSSPKSSLRLELPTPRMDPNLGQRIHERNTNHTCNRHRGFGIQSLLGVTYPTTPEIGLNNSPTICLRCNDGENAQSTANNELSSIGRITGAGGAATTSSQHCLLATGAHIGRGLLLLTPPDDNGSLDWQQDSNRRLQFDQETISSSTDIEKESPILQAETFERRMANPSSCGSPDKSASAGLLQTTSDTSESLSQTTLEQPPEEISVPTDEDWIGNAMEHLVGSALTVCMATEAIRMLSYTLPCPLPEIDSSSANPANPDRLPASAQSAVEVAAAAGQQLSPTVASRCTSNESTSGVEFRRSKVGISTALHYLTAAVQRRYMNEGPRRVYIHVSHAINPQISLNRLPSTPPATGGFSSQGFMTTPVVDDGETGYFSPTVFNSIVVTPSCLTSISSAESSLNHNLPSISTPILPPNSLHLTLLERYIPPTSPLEDAAMFSTRSSILIDRLYELSPQGGSLLFIYPTKTGAMNFDRDYLGPVLDPLLRKLMVLYGLREDLLWGVRNMTSTPKMAEFSLLRDRIERVCNALSSGDRDRPPMPTKLIYSGNVKVSLNELSWREWWTQQEQIRIRDIVKKHISSQPTGSFDSSSHDKEKIAENKKGFWQGYGVPGDLAREVLDGVRAPAVRPSSRGMGEAVLASSMSGCSGIGGGLGGIGIGGISGGTERLETFKERGIEVGIFILRRGLDNLESR